MSTRVSCKNILLMVSVLVLLPLISCQVGLGSAVDTESPTIDITYPPAAAVIKGTFTLAGTCSDDQGVSSITVTVTNTDNKAAVWSYETSAAPGGKSWTASLNRTDTASATGFLFPDGKYEASVIAKDSSGHSSGTASRAFEIDNSAPVCILTSPASTDTASPTAYGANFKITGTIADDHTIKTMAVSVFDKSGNAVGGTDTTPFTENNVETAGGTVVYIAKYINGGTSELNTRYSTIYDAGDTSSDTRAYACSITLTDAAKEYTDPAVPDDKNTTTGNATSVFYLSDAVKASLDADGLEASDVKKILNGTYSGSADTATQTAVKELFKKNEQTKAAFSLNPDASPKYSVTGYSFTGAGDIGNNSATAKQKIQITATAGRDGTYVNPATIIVYQFGPFAAAAALSADVLSSIYTDPASYAESNPSVSHKLQNENGYYDNTAYSSGSVESYSYPVRLYSTIETKKYFVLAVTGQDVNGADMTPQDGTCYGFVGSASGTPPTISWDGYDSGVSVTKNIADLGFINTSGISFSGSAASKSSTIKSVAYTVTVTDESSSGSGTEIETYSGTAASGDGTFDGENETWSFNIADASGYTAYTAGSSIAYLYTIDLTVMDENGNTTASERRIHVDTIDPSVNISSVSPSVTRNTDSKKCVNGIVTIGANISDTNFQTSSYSVYVGGSTVPGLTDIDITNKGYSPSIIIDTTKLTDGSTLNIVVTVKDKAGNEASGSTTLYNSNTSYVIDQSTDKPDISLSNADTSLTSADKIKTAYTGKASKTNIFGTSSNNKLLGTVTDDDGIASISIAYDTASDGQYANTIYKNDTVGGTTSFTIPDASFSKLPEGLYYLKITVADTKQATSYATYTTDYFAVAVDNGGPSFSSVTPANDGYYSASKPLSVAGTITDSSGVVTISMNSGNGTGSPQASLKSGSTTVYTLSDTVTPPDTDGSYTIVYTAADRYGQTSSYEINYMVDTTAPSILLPATSSNFTKTTTKSVEVYVSDQCSTDGTPYSSTVTSGIATVAYSINSGSGNSGTLNYYSKYTGSTNDTINKYYSVYKGTIILTDGVENIITYTVTDNAGNSYIATDPSTYTVDASAPVITINGGTDSISTTSTNTGNISFTVTATDNKSIGSLSISDITNSTGSVTEDTDYTISETDALPTSITKVITILGTSAKHDGTWSFTLNAADSAGWTAETRTISVQVDTVRPGFKLDSAWISAQSTAIIYKKANTETVSGYITNDTTSTGTGVSAVYARVINAAADTDAGARTFTTETASDWTNESSALSVKNGTTYFDIPVDLSDSTYTGDQQYNVYLAAVDGAGNVSTAISAIMITPDATVPAVTIADTHSSEYFKAGTSIALSGTVTEKYLSTFKLYASNGITTTDISAGITTIPSSGTLQTWAATYTVPADTADGTWNFYATATDKAGQAGSSASVTAAIDTTVPVVSITSISPTVDSTKINGIVTVSYTIADTNFDSTKVTYNVYSADTAAPKITDSLVSASGTFTIDTKNLTDLKAMTITVTAVDKAGNSGSGSSSAYTVDESTDTPEVTFSNTTKTIKNVLATDNTGLLYSGNTAGLKNIFGATSNNKILGTVTDDDGLASVAVWSKPYSAGNAAETPGTTTGWTECPLLAALTVGSTSYTLNAKVPVTEGQYSIKVVSTDTKGETAVSSGTEAFAIAVDNGAPSFTITTSSGQYFKQNSTQDVTFSINDGSGSVTVTGSNYPAGVTGAVSGTTKDTLTFDVNAVGGTITYTATDLYGQASTAAFNYIIDITAPTLKVDSGIITELNTGKIYETSSYYSVSTGKYTYSGSWTDTQSGTSVIEYSTDGGSTWIPFDAATSKTETGTTWSVSLELTEGENQKIAFRAEDAAGNWTTPVSGSTSFTGLTFDFSVPQMSTITLGGGTLNAESNVYYVKYNSLSQTLSGTAAITDTLSMGAANGFAAFVTPTVTLNNTSVNFGPFSYDGAGTTATCTSTNGAATITETLSGAAVTVTFSVTIGTTHNQDGTWAFKIDGTDAAGRSAASVTASATVDTVAPEPIAYNAAGYIFQVNDKDWSDSTWYKTTTMRIKGYFTENTSGLDKVYYYIQTPGGSAPASGTIVSDSNYISLTGSTGGHIPYTFTLAGFETDSSTNPNIMYIQAEDKAGNISTLSNSQYIIHIDQDAPSIEADSSYTDAILTNGKSDIPVTGTTADAASGIADAVMYIGNSTSYKILYNSSSAVAATSYVLTTDTSFTAGKTYYTDTSGTVSGDTAGDPSAKGLYVQQKAYTSSGDYGSITLIQSGDYSVNKSKWTLDINPGSSWFTEANLGTNPGVYAVITDKAENASSKTKLCSLQIDTVPPKADISTPLATGSGLNGKQTITGTVTESNTPTSISLYYYSGSTIPADLADWTRFKTITTRESPSSPDASTTYGVSVSSIYNWNIPDFDFASLAGADGTATVYILPVAYDKAGNGSADDGSIAAYSSSSGYTGYTTYTVDQDTDRPVINFTNLTLATMTAANPIWLKNANVIYGTITDDDGITSLAYNTDRVSTWTDIPVSNGAWNLKLDDGEKTIYFKVVDKAETMFTSAASADIKSPKLSDGTITFADYTILHLNVDKTPPEYGNIKYKVYDTDTTAWSSDWIADYSNEKFGGKHSKFKLQLEATDNNGIASVTASLGTKPTVYTGTKDSGDTTGKTWIIDNILVDSAHVKDGSNTITITVTDGAELNSTASMQIAVDNTSPAITVLGPSSATSSSGNITVYGSVDGTADVYYAVSPSGTVSPDSDSASTTFTYDTTDSSGNTITEKDAATISAATAYTQITDASLSWYIYFDAGSGDTKTHSETLNNWLDTLGITTTAAITANSYTDITKLYVWIKSIDSYGNKTEKAHLILLDPQGDRPTVDIDYPETDGTALGGTVKLYGSAEDNSAVKNVFVQIMSEQHSVSEYEANGTAFGTFAYNSSTYVPEAFTPSEDDLDYLAMAGYKIYKMSNTVTSASTGYWIAGTSSLATGERASDYGILATLNGSSWSLKVNTNGELNPAGDTSNIVAVRAYAYDDTAANGGNKSLAASRIMKFDKNNPIFGSISLVQSEGISNAYKYSSDTTAEQECASGIYVRGTWYVKGSVTDDNGISDLIISDNNTDYSLVSTGTPVPSTQWEAVQDADGKTCYFKYTLNTASGVGKHVITVTAKDGTTMQYSSAYSATVNYDNTAPVLAAATDSSYDISPSISQSDSFYTMSSTVTEASVGGVSQSGFKRLAFYFVRRYGSSYAYDPMLVKSSPSNKIDLISGTDGGSITYNSGLFWKVKTVTWSSDSANVVTLSTSDVNIHAGGLLKANGIIYTIKSVNGETVTLDGNLTKSPGTVYAALALVVDNTVSEGYSTSASLESDGYYSPANLTNDDGDRMIEYVSNTGTVWSWQANICSKNIPDGPIEVHYTAFDAAGNYSTGIAGHVSPSDYSAYKNTAAYDTADVDAYAADSSTVSVYAYDNSNPAFVSNNRPRIAGVTIGTDYNNNGTIDSEEEESSYSAANYAEDSVTGTTTDGKKIYDPTAKSLQKYKIIALPADLTLGKSTSALMTLKGYSEIIPEIVGGNGAIYYQYSCGALSGKNSTTPLVTDGSTDYTINTSETIKLQLGDLIQAGDTDNTPFVFTFWDSTDGAGTFASTTAGRQYAKLTLYLGVSVQAVGTPEAKIIPFYWNSSSDNSLYGTNENNGHIELPVDLASVKDTSGNAVFSDSNSGEYDLDPKVSGKVVIRGTAHDVTRINKLYISVPGMENVFENTSGANITDTVTVNSVKYYCLAAYSSTSGKLVPVDGSPYGFALAVSKDTISSSGHDVNWAFSWDTSKINTVAATDVKVQVLAYNQGKPSCETGSTHSALGHLSIDGTTYYSNPTYAGEKANTPDTAQTKEAGDSGTSDYTSLYKMDVVPYIKGVKTSLSTLKKTTSSVYDRTALGHYPVKSTLDAYFYGFNLAANATVSDSAPTAHTTTLGSENTSLYSGYTVYPAAVSSLTSGSASVVVNTVTSLNNKNLNDAKGSYTGTTNSATGDYSVYSNYYNRQPNNENNNNLTDDVVLDVWTVKNSARSHSGTLTEPVMRIVPADTASTNDVIRFAFTNGAEYFSMAPAYSTRNSYQYWQKNYADFNNVAFTYDSEGNSYGITTGLDTNPDGTRTVAGRMTFISSRWGECNTTDKNDNYYGFHKLRLEAIGIMKGAYVQGTKLNDDYIMDTRRFNSPSLATAVHSGSETGASTSVYLAYYDKFQKQIRFRYGTFNSNTPKPTSGDSNHNAGFNQFQDQHGQADTNNRWNAYYHNDKYAFDAAFDDYSLIAGKDAESSADTGYSAGKYVAIDVIPGGSPAEDIVVAVWYDGSDLKYSYKLNPYTDNDAEQTHAGTSGYWSKAKTIFTGGGKYCAIKVDQSEEHGIHIAAQDSIDQDLKYAYLPAYDAGYSESVNSVTVDSYAITGTQVQIDTEIESGKVIPYISYYNGATEKPKMAYLVPQDTMNYTAAGADSTTEMFTGKWEATIVPTDSEVQDDHMNIGLWKNKSGKQRTNVASGSDSGIDTDVTSGYSYGNGTANPVVGYATVKGTQGYIETAQKQ